jgi:hypothetical protein
MTGEQDQAGLMAARIARRVAQSSAGAASTSQPQNGANIGAELSAMRASLDDLKQRLVQIESRLPNDKSDAIGHAPSHSISQREAATASRSSFKHPLHLSGIYMPAATHPSQEKFGVEEATVAELVDFFEGEKKCELEPGGKPCDHCSMCNSRGF